MSLPEGTSTERSGAIVVERVQPPAPPPLFRLTFSHHQGWAILAALKKWVDANPEAAEVEHWRGWIKQLDAELHR